MKYLCLVYATENALQTFPVDHCIEFDDAVRGTGQCKASEALQPTTTAVTVRVRNGKPERTDGPFMETKEVLGGFYLVEAADMEEALRIAEKIPPAAVGSIEVRPIRDLRS